MYTLSPCWRSSVFRLCGNRSAARCDVDSMHFQHALHVFVPVRPCLCTQECVIQALSAPMPWAFQRRAGAAAACSWNDIYLLCIPPKGYIIARHVSDTQFVEADIKVYCWPQQMSNSSKRYIDRLAFSLTLCLKALAHGGGHHGAFCRELRMEPRVTSLIQCRVA